MDTTRYIAYIVARLLTRKGYNPIRACGECSDANGFLVFQQETPLEFLADATVWRIYAFMDGSSLEVCRHHMILRPGNPWLDKIHNEIEGLLAPQIQPVKYQPTIH